MDFVEKIKTVITAPDEFFEKIETEKGIKPPFMYNAIIGLIVLAVFLIIPLAFSEMITGMTAMFDPTGGMMGSVLGGILSTLAFFIAIPIYLGVLGFQLLGAGMGHIFIRIVGGRNGFAETYKALTYGFTPAMLFGWVPLIGVAGILYSVYLGLKGVSRLQDISMGRAFIAFFILPAAIFGVIVVILIIFLLPLMAFAT